MTVGQPLCKVCEREVPEQEQGEAWARSGICDRCPRPGLCRATELHGGTEFICIANLGHPHRLHVFVNRWPNRERVSP